MKTRQYARRCKAGRRILILALILTVVGSEAWLMGQFFGSFGSTDGRSISAETSYAPDITLAFR